MKPLKLFFKPISYLLTFLILMQGCTVYKKQNTLEQAAATKDKAKLITKENEKQKYLYITTINEEYYGINEIDGKLTKFPLQENNIEIIKTEDKVSSTLLSLIALPIGVVLIVIITQQIIGEPFF